MYRYDILPGKDFMITGKVLINVIANPLANFLYGDEFTGVGPVLAIHVWAGVFAFWGSASTKWFVIERIPQLITVSTVLGCTTNILANLVMIPRYGIVGASLSTLFAQSIAVVLSLLLFKKTRKLFWIIIRTLNPAKPIQIIRGFLNKKAGVE